ncbi:uncharacterized protein AKAME5_002053100 [Lates japonicus]|uniref:Uncharacterized protein n=1 Tax=Lates japonicus TaxID=270547 RepID=A0AAD3NBC5_LATJO|nr:uncharacterized protein AKAME5_002053100 [Lates japonicus]
MGRHQGPGDSQRKKNQFLLFTKGRGPLQNNNVYLRMAWRQRMGIKSSVAFTLIRMAMATHGQKKSMDPAETRTKCRLQVKSPASRDNPMIVLLQLMRRTLSQDSGDSSSEDKRGGRAKVREGDKGGRDEGEGRKRQMR